jgi:multimeric flavodoxin WrbA
MSQGEKLVVAINGSPRKGWNTGALLEEVLRGAKDEGAATRRFDLFNLNFKGCASCFSCKRVDGYLKGVCAQKDDLAPILTLLGQATGVAMGSPIYIGDVTGCLRNFWERYIFINLVYDRSAPSVLERGPGLALIYATNLPEAMYSAVGYDTLFAEHKRFFLERLKPPFLETLHCSDTLQFADYGQYHAPMFDPVAKKKSREERFPQDLAKAYEIGRRLGKVTEPPLLKKDANFPN